MPSRSEKNTRNFKNKNYIGGSQRKILMSVFYSFHYTFQTNIIYMKVSLVFYILKCFCVRYNFVQNLHNNKFQKKVVIHRKVSISEGTC